MEASALFVLAATHAPRATSLSSHGDTVCRAAAVFGVFGTDKHDEVDPERVALAESRVIKIALAAVGAWAKGDRHP